jgi:hypothetical protein
VRVRAGDCALSSVTRDVSAGGVCVAPDGDPGDGSVQLTITVANHDVVAAARVVRVSDSDLGVEFEHIEDRDRLLLASLALAYHRSR